MCVCVCAQMKCALDFEGALCNEKYMKTLYKLLDNFVKLISIYIENCLYLVEDKIDISVLNFKTVASKKESTK